MPDSRGSYTRKVAWSSFVEFFALCGIAVVQPLLDTLTKNVGIFVADHTTPLQAIVLVLLIGLVPPLACLAVETIVAAVAPRLRAVVHSALIALLVGVIVVEILKRSTSLSSILLIVFAVVVGAICALALALARYVHVYLAYLAFAVPVFSVLFVAVSPVTPVIFNSSAGATSSGHVAAPRRVVIVVMDEFPEMSLLDGTGRIDSQLYPHFAALAAQSTWYRNDTTVSSFTSFAVPAILTGRFPQNASDVPDVSSYPKNLFTLLGNTYRMNVHETVTHLCPAKLCTSSASGGGFGDVLSETGVLWRQLASPERKKLNPVTFSLCSTTNSPLRNALGFVHSLKPSGDPELDFDHIELPHQPWHLNSSFQDSGCTRGPAPLVWSESDPSIRQRHLLQVEAADTLLGRIIGELKAIGAFDNSLVIVTADHGVAFTDGAALRGVSARNYPQIMWTPLLVKYPGQAQARVDDRVAESVDIVPTIVDVLGVRTNWKFDGQSLRTSHRNEGLRPIFNWGASTFDLPVATKLPPGHDNLEFDGARGFATVLKARAVPTTGDPSLRIYRSVEFGSLVGKRAERPSTWFQTAGHAVVTDLASRFAAVHPFSHNALWAWGDGTASNLGGEQYIAIALNGTIAAVAHLASAGGGKAAFRYIIPPSLTRRGRNDVQEYLVSGTSAKPLLEHV